MELQVSVTFAPIAQTVCRKDTVTECAMYPGLSIDFVKNLPAPTELVERPWQECEAAHDITAGAAHRFRKRSKNGRIRR
jgi:hypothetical protein